MTDYHFTSPTETANRQADQMAAMYDQLEQARGNLISASMYATYSEFDGIDLEAAAECREEAIKCLCLALGFAKRAGKGYAAGRILTAIQWAKRIGGA